MAPISTGTTVHHTANGYFKKQNSMWGKKDKIWMHYLHDIIAADLASGVFLAHFLRQLRITRDYINSLEIIDLQRYRVMRTPAKVRRSISDAHESSFIFVISKN